MLTVLAKTVGKNSGAAREVAMATEIKCRSDRVHLLLYLLDFLQSYGYKNATPHLPHHQPLIYTMNMTAVTFFMIPP